MRWTGIRDVTAKASITEAVSSVELLSITKHSVWVRDGNSRASILSRVSRSSRERLWVGIAMLIFVLNRKLVTTSERMRRF